MNSANGSVLPAFTSSSDSRRIANSFSRSYGSDGGQTRTGVLELPRPATVAVGTEIHMVRRLAAQHPDKTIVQLCGELFDFFVAALFFGPAHLALNSRQRTADALFMQQPHAVGHNLR